MNTGYPPKWKRSFEVSWVDIWKGQMSRFSHNCIGDSSSVLLWVFMSFSRPGRQIWTPRISRWESEVFIWKEVQLMPNILCSVFGFLFVWWGGVHTNACAVGRWQQAAGASVVHSFTYCLRLTFSPAAPPCPPAGGGVSFAKAPVGVTWRGKCKWNWKAAADSVRAHQDRCPSQGRASGCVHMCNFINNWPSVCVSMCILSHWPTGSVCECVHMFVHQCRVC